VFLDEGSEMFMRDCANDSVGQGRGTIYRGSSRIEPEQRSGERKMKDLTAPIFDQAVQEHPSLNDIVKRCTRFSRPKQIVTGLNRTIAGLIADKYPPHLQRTVLAQILDTCATGHTIDG
jgi:hypothetical protein